MSKQELNYLGVEVSSPKSKNSEAFCFLLYVLLYVSLSILDFLDIASYIS